MGCLVLGILCIWFKEYVNDINMIAFYLFIYLLIEDKAGKNTHYVCLVPTDHGPCMANIFNYIYNY